MCPSDLSGRSTTYCCPSLASLSSLHICSRPLPRAGCLPNIVSETASQVLQEPLDMDTIQRELPHELDQVHLEVLQLRKQVAEIEKHLRSAQKEGGGASGRQQPHASDTEAVGGEVGALWVLCVLCGTGLGCSLGH